MPTFNRKWRRQGPVKNLDPTLKERGFSTPQAQQDLGKQKQREANRSNPPPSHRSLNPLFPGGTSQRPRKKSIHFSSMRRCFCPGKRMQVERILRRKVSYAEPETCRLTCWDGYTSPAGDGPPSSTWFRLLPSYKELTYRTDAQTSFILASLPWSLLRFMSIESIMPSNHIILCHPLLLLSIFPSIRVFSNQLALPIRWPKYWSFSFSITTSNSGLISFRIDWFDLLRIYTCGLFTGEGNGNPLQYSCLANPMDGGAWWAAVCGVTQSDTTEVTSHSIVCLPAGPWNAMWSRETA